MRAERSMPAVFLLVTAVLILARGPAVGSPSRRWAICWIAPAATSSATRTASRYWRWGRNASSGWSGRVNPGTNLSRANPGGGMVAPRHDSRRIIKADYLLVQAGPGRG